MNTFFADPARYSLSDLVNHILIIQTDFSWPKEAECLENHGSSPQTRAGYRYDNGHFRCRIAEGYTDKQFVGIETSEPLMERASEFAREMSLTT